MIDRQADDSKSFMYSCYYQKQRKHNHVCSLAVTSTKKPGPSSQTIRSKALLYHYMDRELRPKDKRLPKRADLPYTKNDL